MFEQQFMTQMSNWVTDMPFDVYFQVDDIYIFLTFWCDLLVMVMVSFWF